MEHLDCSLVRRRPGEGGGEEGREERCTTEFFLSFFNRRKIILKTIYRYTLTRQKVKNDQVPLK